MPDFVTRTLTYVKSAASDYIDFIEPYVATAGRYISRANSACAVTYDYLRLVTNFLNGCHYITVIAKSKITAFSKMAGPLDAAQGIVSMIRVVPAIHQTITLQFIFKTDDNGQFVTDDDGNKIVRPVLVIIRDVSFNAARVLSPINWGHRIGLYDLGKASAGIGLSISALYTIGSGAHFFSEVEKFNEIWDEYICDECEYVDVQIQLLQTANAFVQFLLSPVENGFMYMSKNPIIGAVGHFANAGAALFDVFTDALAFYVSTHRD